ncbi:hypothetical protein SacmaDRAFT_3831 [Saccharomonospora marina XMU15]|uniref:Uncharacterized protein n=1 Tax=Saccharomonospora marina XMU15 TaxID=882083 RepID=H5X1W6_9PSEU|nr:hypothetical protein [Saccharomonospora marina]EHR52035.1 hypothetical protein SacmaDRAFT_3831 [Saccharomonospora marina XMU15]
MTRVKIATLVRLETGFVSVDNLERYDGDPEHVAGAISLVIDGTELLGADLWDDVNWLWPLIVHALDDYRRTGSGKCGFPDQPIAFSAESAGAGTVLIRVFDGESIERSSAVPEDDLFEEVARAGIFFFDELQRICPGTSYGVTERTTLEGWRR